MITDEQKGKDGKTSWLGIGAVLTAIGASVCCVGPLLLLSLGIGGAWISTLTSMEAVRPFFLVVTLLLIWMGFVQLYFPENDCKEGAACASDAVNRRQRLIFWLMSGAILLLLAFPWYAPFFME